MNNKVYVGNLPYGVTSEQLGQMFAEAGEVVEATVILDKYSGRSKGFGFVEFADDAAAQEAIKLFNDKEVEGRKMVVNIARPREDK